MSLEAVEQLFLLFERHKIAPLTLILSGGEVFLEKDNLFGILTEARQRFKSTSLHIQTNGLLIDDESIARLRHLDVSLEFGIDGTPEATIQHRRGLGTASFKKLTETIQKCLNAGLKCGSTMTIHPHEIQHMQEGMDFLRNLGLPHVDVTPAAFTPWTMDLVDFFKKEHLELSRRRELRKVMYANEDIEWINPGAMDLSLHPPNYLLGGDPFLCLPEEKRVEFNLWSPDDGHFRPKILSIYQDAYEKMHRRQSRLPYREHVCHSLDLVNAMMGYSYVNTWAINDIMRFLTRTHLALGIKNHGT